MSVLSILFLVSSLTRICFALPFNLIIESARGLKNGDSGIIGKKSDPKCNVFGWGPGTNFFKHALGSTGTVSDDLSPTWNAHFTYSSGSFADLSHIEFEVMDVDNIFQGSYEHLGTTDPVSLLDLPCGIRNDLTLPLLGGGGDNPTIDVAITPFDCPPPPTKSPTELPSPAPVTSSPSTSIPTRNPIFAPCNTILPDKDECITSHDCIGDQLCFDRTLPNGDFHEIVEGDICDPNCICYCI